MHLLGYPPSRRGSRNAVGLLAATCASNTAGVRAIWIAFSIARPGGNATGFTSFEFSMSGKWLELLKEIAPRVARVAVIRDPAVPAGSGGLAAIQTVAPSLGVELTPVGVRDAGDIERAITTFARGSKGGVIMGGPPSSV